MKTTQLTKGQSRRLMYLENKNGLIDGAQARIGWVSFSKTGRTVYYRDFALTALKGGGISGNFINCDSGDEFWVSGIKKRGSNVHRAERVNAVIDEDAKEEYLQFKRLSRA